MTAVRQPTTGRRDERRRVRRTAVAVLVALASVAAGCSGGDGPGRSEARLEVDGSASVTSEDGSTEVVTGAATLDFGDVVTVDAGTASLEFASGQRYEFRSGVGGAVDSQVVIGFPPTLVEGDALVADGFPAAISYDTITISAQGAVKVRAGVPEAAAYAGRVRIDGAGRLDELTRLRQVVLTSSARPEPLAYDGADAWDRRFLGEAIAFGDRLEALARGYTSDLQRSGPRPASFFESVLPQLADEREFGDDLLDADRDPGETLVGAAIVIQGREGTFRERWDSVFAFRDEGAAWGLVALDQGVSSAPVLDSIELAIDGSPLSADPRPSTTTTTTRPRRPPTTSPGSPPTSGTTTTTTPPDPPPPPDDGILTPVLTPVEQILSDVLDALGLG